MIKNKGHILGLSFLELIKRKPPGGVLKSMLTLNEAIIDVKEG